MSEFRSLRRNPWWIPPFLGGVPDVESRLIEMLGLVSLALFFEQYDNSMLTAALKHIATDLRIGESDLSGFLAIIRLGALPSLFLVQFADRIGRRRIFLASVIAFSLGTLLTGFAQTAPQFVVLQMFTRMFMLAGSAVAAVIVIEEFPAAHRGWAIGMIGALASCGQGMGAALFAAVDVLPYGWRFLYAVGFVPLLLVPKLRARVTETARFRQHSAARGAASGPWYEPLQLLARTYPGRTLGVAVVGGLFAVGEVSVLQLSGYFAMTVHGWTPGQYSLMFIGAGAVGILGNVVAGRAGDRVGRRTVGVSVLSVFPLSAWAYYNGPSWLLPIAWAVLIFCLTAASVVVRALSTELFPTSYRSASSAWVNFVMTLGWSLGLAIVSWGTNEAGDLARMVSAVATVSFAAAIAVMFLPETYRQELEVISHEPDGRGDDARISPGQPISGNTSSTAGHGHGR
jgi:MFS family permease